MGQRGADAEFDAFRQIFFMKRVFPRQLRFIGKQSRFACVIPIHVFFEQIGDVAQRQEKAIVLQNGRMSTA